MRKIPNHIEESILKEVNASIKPKLSSLSIKLFLVHALSAVITLSICSQFGIKLFNFPIDLMQTVMFLGMPFCDLFCGVVFTTISVTSASILMKRDELRYMRYNRFLTTAFLILTSIGFFFIMKPNFFLDLSGLWLLGAMLGSVVTLEIQWKLKQI